MIRDLESFLMDCEIYLGVNRTVYDNDTKKVGFILSLLSEGNAAIWKMQWYKANLTANNNVFTVPTVDAFVRQLRDSFKEVDEEGSSMVRLENLKQKGNTVEEHNNRFKLLVQRSGLTEQRPLVNFYRRSINPAILDKIIAHTPLPTTLEQWMEKAVQLDKNWRMMKGILDLPRKTSKGADGRKYFNFKSTSYRAHDAMDVDALTGADQDGQKKQYRCYNCDRPGHFANECRQPKRNKGKLQGKKFSGKQRMTPRQLPTHVRAIIDEMDEDEQEEFFNEAEEQGF